MGIGLWGLSPLCEIGISRVSIPNDHLKDTGTWWWLLQKGERTCSSSWNRLVRTRMLGGVGRVPGNGHPYPIYRGFKSELVCDPHPDHSRLSQISDSPILINRVNIV
jgi:hypothetical protein